MKPEIRYIKLYIMKYMRLILLGLLLLPALNLSAGPFDMIPPDDPIIEDIRFLSLEAGKSMLSFTPPFSPGEIEIFLETIDTSLLSEHARQAYVRIENRINPQTNLQFAFKDLIISLRIESTLEGRVRFNTDISWEPLQPKAAPVLNLPLRLHYADTALIYFEPIIASDPEHYGSADVFGSNIPMGLSRKLEMGFPLRGFLAAGGSWWNFQIGRDRLSYGTAQKANLAISDNVDYHEFFRYSLFSDYFKYSMMISQMPLELSNVIYPDYDSLPAGAIKRTMQRYFYLHRLDFNLFNRASVSLMEGVMVGNSAPELRFMNPAILFHQLFSWWNYDPWAAGSNDMEHMVGSLLSIEVNWNIIKTFAIYGQFMMNEASTPHELDITSDQPPSGMGYMFGARFSHSFKKWGSLFFIEFAHTDPYMHTLSSPYASYIHMRYLGWVEGRKQYRYMGYPRDTISITAGTKFFKNDYLSFTGEFSWMSTGEHYNLVWDWKMGDHVSTPSGTVQNKYLATFGFNWKPLSYLSLKGSISGIISRNNGNISGNNEYGGQASLSVTVSY
jgi:hypothetical protein